MQATRFEIGREGPAACRRAPTARNDSDDRSRQSGSAAVGCHRKATRTGNRPAVPGLIAAGGRVRRTPRGPLQPLVRNADYAPPAHASANRRFDCRQARGLRQAQKRSLDIVVESEAPGLGIALKLQPQPESVGWLPSRRNNLAERGRKLRSSRLGRGQHLPRFLIGAIAPPRSAALGDVDLAGRLTAHEDIRAGELPGRRRRLPRIHGTNQRPGRVEQDVFGQCRAALGQGGAEVRAVAEPAVAEVVVGDAAPLVEASWPSRFGRPVSATVPAEYSLPA